MQAFSTGGDSARIRLWRSITSRWVAIGLQSKSVERAQDRRPTVCSVKRDIDPPIKVVDTGYEVMLFTKGDEHDLPTPRWECCISWVIAMLRQGCVAALETGQGCGHFFSEGPGGLLSPPHRGEVTSMDLGP